MTAKSRPGTHYLGNVQALRAVAALLVVAVHANLPNVGVESVLPAADAAWLTPFHYVGLAGVDLFFVISGFIMLVTNWENFAKPRAGLRFFVRRAIRIYPPYWFALAPVLAVLVLAKSRFMTQHVGVKTGIVQSILLLPNPDKFVLTVAWTLVWEMLFYVVFAMLLRFDRKYIVALLAGWALVQLSLYFTLTGSPNFYLEFASTPLPLEFIGGAFVGWLYVKGWFPAPRAVGAFALLVAGVVFSVVGADGVLLENINDIHRVLVFGLPSILLVYAFVGLEVARVFEAPAWCRAIGDGSYSIYLWHISILVVIRALLAHFHPHGPVAHAAILIATFAIIALVGMTIYRFFENPVTRYLNGLLLRRTAVRPRRVFPVIERPVSRVSIDV